jgi:hypothetical protein
MRHFFRNHGLSIVLLVIFVGTMLGQTFTGLRDHNNTQREHHQPEAGLAEYLKTGHFWEATAENWESEFLQMSFFVLLTAWLYQKGSAESKDPDGDEAVDNDPRLSAHDPKAPGPVRKGGATLWLYSHSLSITFLLLFLASFIMHAVGGAREYSEDQQAHGEQAVTVMQYMGTSRFWFESMQNWQSEFLSLLAMVVLTIFLREKGSPESKPVAAPHWESGEGEPKRVPVPVPVNDGRDGVAQMV